MAVTFSIRHLLLRAARKATVSLFRIPSRAVGLIGLVACFVSAWLSASCGVTAGQQTDPSVLRVVAASTAGQTGIIEALVQDFQVRRPGVMVNVQYAGALAVLDRARHGEADLVITHHPGSEEIFVAEGYGLLRTLVMYSDFAIFGPPADPLSLARETDPVMVLQRLAREEVAFMVPDKRSGTHRKLNELWAAAGVEPDWIGYETTESSAAATLQNAALFDAYSFSDTGTYLAHRKELAGVTAPLFRDNRVLRNNYFAMVVSRERIATVNQSLAESLLDYLASDEGQEEIARFGEQTFGTQVFTPAAHLDDGLKARRAAKNLRRMTALTTILAVMGLVATWLFYRTRKLEGISRRSEERFALAVSGTNDGIWDWDRKNNTAYFSPRLYEMLGYAPRNERVKDPVRMWKDRIHPEDQSQVLEKLERYLAGKGGNLFVSEHRLYEGDNDCRWVLMRGKAVRNPSGEAVRMSGSVTDISDRKEQEAALEHQALHDSLTGLPNRMLLIDRIGQSILAASRERRSAALIVLDLDHFKEINDTLGHEVGDLVLKEVGKRIQHRLRKSDTVARLGGDEFAVLLPSADETYASDVAQKILFVLKKAFPMRRQSLHIDGSLGIALYPEHGDDAQSLMKHADVAMYRAKGVNNGYALYDESQDRNNARRLQLANELHDAIDNDALQLHYQPKIDLKAGVVVGVEALLRWQHPQAGMIQPDEMILVAEHSGLIKRLTMWVLDSALAQCAEWRRNGIHLTVAVNLSVWNMQDPNLVEEIEERRSVWDVPANQLELEITETIAMNDPARSFEVLTQLDGIGIRLAVDDFGTGFSSLSYLKKLPVDIIKIDKSFVIGMDRDDSNAAIVHSTIDLAHNLGIEVVAEGVETEAVWNRLVSMGCDTAQGYHFGRPMMPEDLLHWVRQSPWGLTSLRRASAGIEGNKVSDKKIETTSTRLTDYSHGGGCGCKVDPATLEGLLSEMRKYCDSVDLLVGIENRDDAAVFRVDDHQALVFTTDFFTPIVDEPHLYGRIAAANALSDIYAMGGHPLLANAIVGFPTGRLSVETVRQILHGGAEVCQDAGIPLAGGHTIDNPQPIFGLAAVGLVRPDLLKTNATANIGDVLLLTKPIGIGIMATGIKTGGLSNAGYTEFVNSVTALNKAGSWLAEQSGVHTMTDVTGFGLAGHALEMAKAAGVRLVINAQAVPVMEETWALVIEGIVPTGAYRNIHSYGDSLSFEGEWNSDDQLVFTDPQTNGGLLVSVAPDRAKTIVDDLRERGCPHVAVIGEVTQASGTDAAMVFRR